MAGDLVVCESCNRWRRSGGVPICGICRASRAIQHFTLDPSETSANYDLILPPDTSLGEVNSWLAVPLADFADEPWSPRRPPVSGEKRGVEQESSEQSSGKKQKRSSRDGKRRAERREVRQNPPTPRLPPRHVAATDAGENPVFGLIAACKSKASSVRVWRVIAGIS